MAYKITDACISCGACAGACPVECIKQGADKYEINKCLDWILYTLCYTLVIFINDLLFDSLYSKNLLFDFILLDLVLLNFKFSILISLPTPLA